MSAGEVGYDAQYYAVLYELEAANFWFRARNALLLWALDRFVGPAPRRFLEIGCGTGYVLTGVASRFPGWQVAGSEVLEEGLAFARERLPGAELRQLDARHMPYDGELDVVGAFDVLEHIEEDEAVLAEIARSLRPGGWLFVTVPQHPGLWSAADEAAQHVRRYTAGELSAKLARAGFEVRLRTGFVSLLSPAMWLSRLRTGQRVEDYDAEAELKLPRALNAVFEAVMAVERGLIRLGVRFPVGGSLLVAARKPGPVLEGAAS